MTGEMFFHDHTGETVEYIGTALMPELDGEEAHVYRFAGEARCLISTERSRAQGETFTPISQHIADETELL